MATYKRINGDYTIQTVNNTDKIIINSGNIFIEGNLWVTGNTQTISSTDTAINDHTITLNAGSSTPNPAGASIVVDRGPTNDAAITWNETLQVWQITENIGGSYTTANIATTTATGVLLANVSQDTTPSLGGNLNITSHTLYDTSVNVQIFANAVGGGGTGLRVTNPTYSNVELMSKTKSIVYSIIFG
jgi:hypothetical protein